MTQALTVSGPPFLLQRFIESMSTASDIKQIGLPIYGPYHAKHLYSEKCLAELLQPFQETLNTYKPRVQILSSVTGKPIPASTTNQILKSVIQEILQEPLGWDRVVKGVVAEIDKRKATECNVLPAGTADISGLMSALKSVKNCNVMLDDSLSKSHRPKKISNQSPEKFAESKIAIVGMAGRFPTAANHELFWEMLERGTDTHKVIPRDRFDETHIDPAGRRKNTSHTPYGCFVDEPGLFDPRFFRMSPREATQTDPMHRLAILTAYEALEMSGYVPNRTPSTMLHRVGTFYGQTSDDWREIQEGQDIDTYFIPGGVRAFAPGRINYFFKFSGPSFSVDTACSSSFAALQVAVTSLRAEECDTALAGGMNILTNPDIFSGLSRGQFLSKTGNCQTFDNDADGYCRGEAVATVVLKRLADAEADNDNILGVILASETNHSADAISITHPHAPTQERLYTSLLNKAAMNANEVSYVEMHGTGTQAGDGTEMESVTNVFAEAASSYKRRTDQPLHLGSVKANIGHGEAASGMSALIKVLLMMEKNAIPPHCGIKGVINQTFPKDLEARNVHIPLRRTAWPRPSNGQPRKVFISNFSAAGGNTGVLMEDGPMVTNRSSYDPRSFQIVTVSGKSKSSLRNNLQQLIHYTNENPTVDLPSLSYTTTARRMHYNYRIAVVEDDIIHIKASLTSAVEEDIAPISPVAPRVAFVFTGQGAHYAALGKRLFEESSQFRLDILQYDEIAQSQGLPSFQALIDGSVPDVSTLSPTTIQLGSTCVQMALSRLWMSWGVVPSSVIGHSLGEYAALNVAGVLSASDCIYLVGKRALVLETVCSRDTHAMLAMLTPLESVEPFMEESPLEIACINSPNEVVLGGLNEHIDRVAEIVSRRGIQNTKLRTAFAFHCSQVDPILDSYQALAAGVKFNAPSIPVISPLLKEVIRQEGSFDPAYVRRHAREAVNFPAGLEAGYRDGIIDDKTVWVEIGPHPICLPMVKKVLGPDISTVPSLRRHEDPWRIVSRSLATLHNIGLDISWNEYHRDFNSAHRLLRLPVYQFDFKKYWIDYTGNWCLTKGDIGSAANASPPKPRLSTSSVQNIIDESHRNPKATVIIESDLTDPALKAAIQGHQVNDNSLCPSSLYADMAMTIAGYLYQQLKPESAVPALDVKQMSVDKPLIIAEQNEQRKLRASGTADVITGKVDIQFYSVFGSSDKKTNHAECVVEYVDAEKILLAWERSRYLYQPRIEALLSGVQAGTVEKMRRDLAYALFGTFVKYGPSYRGIEEVAVNFNEYEATAKVAFQSQDNEDNFMCSPYWIDSIGHLSGFIVNVKESLGSRTQVFVSHGWDSLCVARPLSKDKVYRTYVKMQPAGGKMMAGDVIVFEEDKIIAVFGGLKFQAIPRTLLNTFLPPPGNPARKAAPADTMKRSSLPKDKERPRIPAKAQIQPIKETRSNTSNSALNVVAEEVGVALTELSNNVVFDDIGVDSLMSLTISAKLRESLDIDVSSTLFADCPTVGDFMKHFSQHDTVRDTSPSSSSSSSGLQSKVNSPPSERVDFVDTPASSTAGDDMVDIIRSTIAKQMGVPIEEIVGATQLESLGMDSLMSLTVLAELREATGQEFSNDFFVDNPSIEAIMNSLNPNVRKSRATPEKIEKALQREVVTAARIVESSPARVSQSPSARIIETPPARSMKAPAATSFLLQGNPKTASKTLFLFPDGSGSATSYACISKIDSDVALYGLNCPYMKIPEKFVCGIVEVATLYKEEVQRRQPKGPYYIGGWSAGGIVAYEVALQLIREGFSVERLLFLDSPCPLGLEPLPPRLHNFFDEIGLLGTGTGKMPTWLVPHFTSTIRALDTYRPAVMDPASLPKAFFVWATDGVCGKPGDPQPPSREDDPKSMKWLLQNRTEFESNGWDALLEKGKMTFTKVKCNHFTMMREPVVSTI